MRISLVFLFAMFLLGSLACTTFANQAPEVTDQLSSAPSHPVEKLDYVFTVAGMTMNTNLGEPKDSYLTFDVMDIASDFWSIGIVTFAKDGINASTESIFWGPVGLFFPIARWNPMPDKGGMKGLIHARARLFTLDGTDPKAGLKPKAWQATLAYDAPILWGVDLTYCGAIDEEYDYMEGIFLRLTVRAGWTVFF